MDTFLVWSADLARERLPLTRKGYPWDTLAEHRLARFAAAARECAAVTLPFTQQCTRCPGEAHPAFDVCDTCFQPLGHCCR